MCLLIRGGAGEYRTFHLYSRDSKASFAQEEIASYSLAECGSMSFNTTARRIDAFGGDICSFTPWIHK